ncbi:MAG: hypothetical protein Q7W30_02740, partial [Coriobacteriia bacterium]|nr:hypothetical protein [Coriobacteriia bacterium]
DNALMHAPLVKLGTKLVVAAPCALCTAATHAAVAAIDEAGGRAALRKLFEDTVLMELGEVTDRLGLERVAVLADPPAGTQITLTSADENSAVVFVCVSDTDAVCEDGSWNLASQLGEALRVVRERVLPMRERGKVTDLAVLVLIQRLNRNARARIPAIDDARADLDQWLTLEELGVVADTFPREWNRFRYFLEDLREFEGRSEVMVWSVLDILGLWREKGDSLYLGDDYPRDRTAIVLSTESSGSLRRHVGGIVDRHSVAGYRDDTVFEVVRFYRTFDIPLYVPRLLEYPAIVFESNDDDVQWVVVPEPTYELPIPVEPQFLEAIAFWLWRLRIPWRGTLVIEVRLGDVDNWKRLLGGEPVEASGDGDLVTTKWLESDRLEITVLPAFAQASTSSDDAELELMMRILAALKDAVSAAGAEDIHAARARLDSWRQDNRCRMLNTSDGQIELDPRGLETPVSIEPSLEARILDELGSHVAGSGALDMPLDSQEQIRHLLFSMVDHLYERLSAEVAKFDERLIEALVVESESQLRETRLSEQRLAHSYACFSDVADIIKKNASEVPRRASAAIATRFLIEYVAAVPSAGGRRASRADLEGLLALASVLTDYAHEAELANVGLGPTSARMLPSGRVGLSRQWDVMDAQRVYLEDILRIQVEVADDPASPSGPSQAEVDTALRAEFGLGSETLIDVFSVLSDLASPGLVAFGRMSQGAIVGELTARLHVDASTVATLIDRLCLSERDDFQIPPPGHTTADLWPWRFGRTYSYISRPLVRRSTSEGSEILWGPRHVFNSGTQLLIQVVTGRFKGESEQMRRLQGRVNHLKGEEFNDRVAFLIGGLEGFVVHPRFDGTRNHRMPQELGDIDVLAADPSRHKLWAIECKSFPMTRVPAELKNDLEELRVAEQKQHARVLWLRDNLPALRAELGLGDDDLEVEPLIVMSALQLSAYVTSPSLSVVHVDDVRTFLKVNLSSS